LLRAAAARAAPYELAIIDMKMPGMDGIELARVVKDDPAIRSVRLVMLTSMAGQRGDVERARKAGIVTCLSTPVRQADLYNRLVRAMSDQPPACAAIEHGVAVAKPRLIARSRRQVLVAEDHPVNQEVALAM